MRENLLNYLTLWKNSKNPKPLILRGARQVGKTYMMRSFARQFTDSVYLNFESAKDLSGLFKDSLEPETVLKNLSLYFRKKIEPDTCLICFDEIQESPDALNSLKYFSESKTKYHILCAGSLLGVKLSEKGFPVGQVDFLDVRPLSFLDSLEVLGESQLAAHLKSIDKLQPLSASIHNRLIRYVKEYLCIGGMPEVVFKFAENPRDFDTPRKIQKSIIDSYLLDFAKHAPKDQVVKISEAFQSLPRQLARENKKFKFSDISRSARSREYHTAIQWLKDAGLTIKVHQVSNLDLPLMAHAEQEIFKMYLLDTGLLASLCDADPRMIIEDENIFHAFKGALTENFVAQELTRHCEKQLYYWTSPGKAEVDFLIQDGNRIQPIEVKSGRVTKSQSLKVFGERYSDVLLSRTTTLNLRRDGRITNYPLYFLHAFPRLS